MPFESSNGTGSTFRYGLPIDDRTAGEVTSEVSSERKLLFTSINGDNVSEVNGVLPAGARIKDVIVVVKTAATLSSAGATLDIGTAGSVATNNVEILDTYLEAAGTYYLSDTSIALNGTWAAELAAETTIAVAPSAGTFTGGDVKVTIVYTV